MNVSLQGARRQSRLDWDAIEQRNQRAQNLPRKVFMAAVVVVLAYLLWTSFAG